MAQVSLNGETNGGEWDGYKLQSNWGMVCDPDRRSQIECPNLEGFIVAAKRVWKWLPDTESKQIRKMLSKDASKPDVP